MNKSELSRESLDHKGFIEFAEENSNGINSLEFMDCTNFCYRLKRRYDGTVSEKWSRKNNGNFVFSVSYIPKS